MDGSIVRPFDELRTGKSDGATLIETLDQVGAHYRLSSP